MDHLDTNEKAPDAAKPEDGASLHRPDSGFDHHMDDKSSYQAPSSHPPSTPSSHGKESGDGNDPDHKINLERDRLGLPHVNRKEQDLTPKKDVNPWDHLGITLGLPMVLIFDIIVPCIIYYAWYNKHHAAYAHECAALGACPAGSSPPEFDKDVLGSAIASFGIGELWILLGRVHRLWAQHGDCAPLVSRSRWELDITSWVYAVAMLVALVPFLVGSSLVMPKLYLYGPSFIMGFLGLLMLASLLPPFPVPVRLSSMPRWAPLRPFIYYAAEDFLAVDGLQDREFRMRFNDRYETNPMFRRFMYNLTLWWVLGVCVYIGSVSAVIWTLDFHHAFGLSLGVLFSYIAVWAVVTYVWSGLEMQREHEAYERGDFEV